MQPIRRILIVEDEKTLSYFLAQSLLKEPEDYEVVTVGSAEEALEAMQARAFGVIIADVVLPQMSGLDLLERVREVEPEACVILITAYGTSEIRARAQALGAFEYVEKPFAFQQMKEAVMRAFEVCRLQAERLEPARRFDEQPDSAGAYES
jgi:DNA-binding NtrC family response regulator